MAENIDEVNAAILEQLKKKIREKQQMDVDAAQGAALTRGITGGSYEGTQTGRARAAATDAETDAMLGFALQSAQRKREDQLLAEERGYQSGERDKDRVFGREERVASQDFSRSERVGSQDFSASQNKAMQDFQDKQRKFQEEYSSLENEKQRAFAAGENDKARQFEAMQSQISQAFQAEESELNRVFQGNQAAIGYAQEEANQRRQQRADLLNTGLGGLASVGGQVAGSVFGKGAPAAVNNPTAAVGLFGKTQSVPVAGAPAAPGLASYAGGGALYAAGVAGGAYGGQLAGKSIFGKNTTGVKVGSLLGASGGNPLLGAVGGVAGGAVGKVTNAVKKIFCFAPDEEVEMKDGGKMQISDLRLGDETAGGVVESIRLAKTDEGALYNYRGVTVTGYHAVKQHGKWVRVKDAEGAVQLKGDGVVCSIVTDQHKVYINGIEFADEVETDYNEFLTIDQSLAVLNGEKVVA